MINLVDPACFNVVDCVTSSVLIVAIPETFTSSNSVLPSISMFPLKLAAPAKVDIPEANKLVVVTRPENFPSLHLCVVIPISKVLSVFGTKLDTNSPPTSISSPVESPIPIVPPLNVAFPIKFEVPATSRLVPT